MKSVIATSLIAVAALSLGACTKPEPVAANLVDNELTLNEAEFPAEGNTGGEYGNSTLGFDDSLGNANADAGPGNEVLANNILVNGGTTLNGQ